MRNISLIFFSLISSFLYLPGLATEPTHEEFTQTSGTDVDDYEDMTPPPGTEDSEDTKPAPNGIPPSGPSPTRPLVPTSPSAPSGPTPTSRPPNPNPKPPSGPSPITPVSTQAPVPTAVPSLVPTQNPIFSTAPFAAGEGRCPSNGTGYMLLASESLTWQQHEEEAMAMGNECHLASILSKEEVMLAQRFGVLTFSALWIGGTFNGTGSSAGQTGPENWNWTDGEEWSFEDWPPIEPSGNGECVQMFRPPYSQLGTWNDADCEGMFPAVYKCCKPML